MIEIKLLPESEIEIVGEISAGDFELHREAAVKEMSQEIKVDGFRPGNVPEKVLAEKIGESVILERMATLALQKEYPEIIRKHKIKAIGRPEILITKIAKDNPLGFKIKTTILPELKLPDYKKVSQEVFSQKEAETEGEAEKKADKIILQQKKRIEVLDKIANETSGEIPRLLIEAEKEKMLGEIKFSIEQSGLKWVDYLGHLKKTEEEVMKDWDKDALKRVKYGLVLNEIAEKENIDVPPEELNRETNKIISQNKGVDQERARIYTYGIIRNEKAFQFLESC